MAEHSLTSCFADALRTTFSVQSKDLPATVNTQAYTDMINRIKLTAAQPSSNIVEAVNNILSKHVREFAHAEQVAKQRAAMGTISMSTTPPNIHEEANAAQVYQPRSSMKDITNGETNGRTFQKNGYGGGKRARFQRHNDQENGDAKGKKITKHVGASYNSGGKRDQEECVFAQIESDNREISNFLNEYRDQLTKGHNGNTTAMSDENSTIYGRVKHTRVYDKQTAQAQAATITHGQEETATAQVITGDGTTFDNSTEMGDDIESNAVATAARLEHLIPAYQQDHPTPVLRTDIAHPQSGNQSSESLDRIGEL
jgi:hypothetical protein